MKKIIIVLVVVGMFMGAFLFLNRKAYHCHWGDYNPTTEGSRERAYHCHSFFEGEHLH